jgi:DnaD/phage-associated family protein
MRWVKLHTQETLFGTTRRELEPAERSLWFDFLCLAGDSPEPGVICVAPAIPYTDGQLCDVLNVPPALLARATAKMLDAGKLERRGNCYAITNWTRYQADYERVRQHRERVTKVTPTPAVTKVTAPPDQTRQEEDKTVVSTAATGGGDALHLGPKNPAKHYQEVADLHASTFGPVTTAVAEVLNDIAGEYPLLHIGEAFKEAVAHDAKSLAYVRAILKRWRQDGYKAGQPAGKPNTPRTRKPAKLPTAEELQAGWGGDAP